MSLSRLGPIASLAALATLMAPGTAHAGKLPLFIVISDNPWMLALGVVLLVAWLVMRGSD